MVIDARPTLMALWTRHKSACRPIAGIIADARAGRLPGVEPLESGFGHRVVDQALALDAMRERGKVIA
jgi:hypothetical protein